MSGTNKTSEVYHTEIVENPIFSGQYHAFICKYLLKYVNNQLQFHEKKY